ncbi:MAG: FtsX-like permease family protein [Verrucomicrobia bacterium]|nr:FtsX-like permease family protein [Verrucomicrobiota bacterium]
MTLARYILRSLVFYRRTHLGVFLGALLAAAILTGSLSVGDSVRYSLRQIALARLGATRVALGPGEHFFREQLAAKIAAQTHAATAPLLLLRGTVALPDASARAENVQIVGVDERFWNMGGSADLLFGAGEDGFAANDRLAERLRLAPGDPVIVRVEEPSALSRDAPLSGASDASVAIRLRLHAVAGPKQFGRFGLQSNQVPPLTIFLPLGVLQKQIKKPGCANVLLAQTIEATTANAALRKAWTLADLNLELRDLPGGAELRTERVFLEPGLAAAALKAAPDARGVLTYLVNEIRLGERATPYSMVTAVDSAEWPGNELAINAWLAEDLGAKPGDAVSLRYYVAAANRQLVEKTSTFKVRSLLPLEGPDASWMPPFPGLADAENCREWEPGIPMDMSRIRPKDEQYWKAFRGTPKAFLPLKAGQAIWANRFGDLTAIRYTQKADAIEGMLRNAIDPIKAGLSFQPVRELALQASAGAQDFGQLFVGFSFFLVIAALLLMAMLFVFSLQQRTTETGLLLALGFSARRVRRFLLWEGFLIAGLGTLAGTAAGCLYARLALHGLSTVWHRAVHFSEFSYHSQWGTLVIGCLAGLGAALLATWIAGRGQARRPAAELLASGAEMESAPTTRGERWSRLLGFLALAGALAALALGGRSADAFFSAGALLLCAGIAGCHTLLAKLARSTSRSGIAAIGMRGAARRPGRSLTTIAVLASGVFMVVAVGAFRADPLAHAQERGSGTGGFSAYGQVTLPVYASLPESELVALRVQAGDDASCLNLNRAQQPSFLGVRPEQLATRKAFTFIAGALGWEALHQPQPDGAVPAIGDEATTRWGLGKSAGETLSCTDERGNPFRVRIVGVIANSILQGSLLLSDDDFVKRFPSQAGNRAFLIDNLSNNTDELLKSHGVEFVPAWRRLAEFQSVESSYIEIFEALGGLGLLLGSAGLGIVVLRNVSERRGELALLLALGFSPRAVRWLVLSEHWLLIALGVGIGGLSAATAILPSMLSPGIHASPIGPLATLGLLALLGGVWSWLAAWLALRGPLLDALRNE